MNAKQIILLLAIVVVGVGVLVYFNMSKENTIAEVETYLWTADMESGEIKNDPLPDIEEMLRKRTPVLITFRGIDARNGSFEKVFSTEDICSEKETKEERRTWWNKEGRKQLETLKKQFTEWKVGKKPFRSYAVVIDVTEGWNGQFRLENFLDENDLEWIKENDFSLDIFAIGYNEVPGRKNIRKGSIEDIERDAKVFFARAPQVMPETQLLKQLHYIFNRGYFKVVCKTDLMEHTKKLKAYDYVVGQEVNFEEYFPNTDNYPKQVVIQIERSNILGINAKRQAWYDVVEENLTEMYPETEFSFE